MKTKLLLPALALFALSFTSCSSDSDDPAPPNQVGSWDLQSYALLNVPSAYSYYEGNTLELSDLSNNISAYNIKLNSDKSFDRSISVTGSLPQNDEGTWEENDNVLKIVSTTYADEEFFDIQRNEGDDLWLSFNTSFGLVKNSIRDTISQEYIDGLSLDELNALFDDVNIDLVLVFDRAQ